MTDNIFEIETTVFTHFAYTPLESVILLTDFTPAYPSVNHSWIFHVLEKAELSEYILLFFTKDLPRQHQTRGICRHDPRTIRHGQGREAMLSSERLSIDYGFRPYLPLTPGRDRPKELWCP